MARILLTGFEPFDGATVNPSWEAVRLLVEQEADAPAVYTAVRLSCVFGVAIDELTEAVRRTEPDLVLCVGQAGGRAGITLERVAVNLDDARIPDNAGNQPIDQPIAPDGPAAYFAALPVKACVAAVRAIGLPAAVSYSAGTFVCNHVAYGLARLIDQERPGLRGGFVHVPYAPEQVPDGDQPSLAIGAMTAALREIVRAGLAGVEVREVGGTLA